MNAEIQNGLNSLLADYQVFYQKLRNYHWNVSGPMFFGLHEKFEELYTRAAVQVDEVAERLLALGGRPVATLAGQLELARLREDPGAPGAQEMVQNVQTDLVSLTASLRELSGRAADAKDTATANLLDDFADEQEKTAWMLRAFLAA